MYHAKQLECLDYLSKDSDYQQILYGGSAGSGKSYLGCDWQLKRRLKYPNTRGLIGRAELKKLRLSTMATFWNLCGQMGLVAGKHYTYNGQDHVIKFFNGSEIILMDMADLPSDADFSRFGSLEISDYFCDEISEISAKAIHILHSRCRYKLTWFCRNCSTEGLSDCEVVDVNEQGKPLSWRCSKCGDVNSGLLPKGLMTCNPSKGWIYQDFYLASKNNSLRSDRMFIQALPTDNPHIPEAYLHTLQMLPEYDRKRLLEGNWEYDDDTDKLFSTENLSRMFRSEELFGTTYITADIARFGKDRTIIGVWNGLTLIKIKELRRSSLDETVNVLRQLQNEHKVILKNIISDEDGLGGGVVDFMKCTGFRNGSKPTEPIYQNLKAQCYFKLASLIEENKLTIHTNEYRDTIIRELEMIKRHKADSDGKLQVTPKEEIKNREGISPDFADMIMMRMYYELYTNYGKYVIG